LAGRKTISVMAATRGRFQKYSAAERASSFGAEWNGSAAKSIFRYPLAKSRSM
jgi:hypothetical protein